MLARRPSSASVLALALAPVLLGGCEALLTTPPATFEAGVEHLPGPGYVEVIGDPERARKDFVITFGDDEGNVFSDQKTTVRAGDVVQAGSTGLPGRERVLVDGRPCLGWFDFVEDATTTVQLRLTGDGCEIMTLRVEPHA